MLAFDWLTRNIWQRPLAIINLKTPSEWPDFDRMKSAWKKYHMITQKQFWILKHMAPGFLHEITSGLEVHWAIFILDSLKYNLIEIRTIVRCNLDSVMFNHLKWKQPKWILLIFDFSVLGARILVITAIVLSAIGAIQVWLACKCCILIDENVKPCLLLATGTIQIPILVLNTGPLPKRVVTDRLKDWHILGDLENFWKFFVSIFQPGLC